MVVTLDLASASHDAHSRRLSELSLVVAKSRRIVVVTGAGISCSSGIPDFRSSDGLYALVKERYPDVVLKGRDLFDASLFRDPTSTALFYTFIAELKASIDKAHPSPTHRFIKTLDTKSKLVRSYTQNIDGFEEREGLLSSSSDQAKSVDKGKGKGKIRAKDIKNVQLHGDIHRVRCTVCAAEFPCTEAHLALLMTGTPPGCPECADRSEARVARSARSIKVGTLRPAIVLYEEPHPLGDEIGAMCSTDLSRKPDLLLIMGTSLKVHGIKKLVKEFCRVVHDHPGAGSPKNKSGGGKVLFINKTPPAGEWNDLIDFHIAGETDAWVEKVLKDWKKTRPADWEVQRTLLDNADGNDDVFRIVRSNPIKSGKGKKKDEDSENIPPRSPSRAWPASSLKLIIPLSPSKRQRAPECEEGSPRKKRMLAGGSEMAPGEKGLLFNRRTANIRTR